MNSSEEEFQRLLFLPNMSLPNLNITWLQGSTEQFGFLPVEDCFEIEKQNFSLENVSCWQHAPLLTGEARVRVIVLGVMTALSLAGNLATMISLSRDKRRLRSTIYTLINQLAVSDLFVTFACLLTESVWTYTVEWRGGDVLCKLVKYVQMFSLYVSTYVLLLIGLDRFVAVRYPLWHNETHRRCGYGIAFVWILSGVLSVPQIAIFRVAKGPFVEDFYQCVTYGFYTAEWQEQLYTTFTLFSMFILPLMTLLFTYTSTFITLQKNEKIFRDESHSLRASNSPDYNRRRIIRRAKMKSLKISFVIVIAFVVCWTPYFTMMLIYIFLRPDERVSQELQKGIFFFGMSNSVINPLIYGAFHLCKCSKRTTTFNLILIQRNGARLRYQGEPPVSTRGGSVRGSTTRTSFLARSFRQSALQRQLNEHQPSTTNLVNVGQKGIRYSFRRPAQRKVSRPGEEPYQEPLQVTTEFCNNSK